MARTAQLVGEGADRRRLKEAEALLPASTTVNSNRRLRARALEPHRCPDDMMRSKESKGSTFVVTLPIAAERIMDSWRHEG